MTDPTDPENQFALQDHIRELEAEVAELRKLIRHKIYWMNVFQAQTSEARRWALYHRDRHLYWKHHYFHVKGNVMDPSHFTHPNWLPNDDPDWIPF